MQDFVHQVGGHSTAKTSTTWNRGLRARNGHVFKPFQSNQRGERERDFYERVFVLESDLPEFATLRGFLPRYYGSIVVPEVEDDNGDSISADEKHFRDYLVLEDLTWGRQWPCIMDVKMGTRSYVDDAPAQKIAYEKSKFPLQETAGLRIQGIKVFDPKAKSYVEFNKNFVRSVSSMYELPSIFRRYFPFEDTAKTIKLLEVFLRRLNRLKGWFDEQQTLEFIASSLLFLYDGEDSVESDRSGLDAYAADIRLIDFAHVTNPSSPKHDEGLRIGITTLLNCFQTLLQEAQAQQDT